MTSECAPQHPIVTDNPAELENQLLKDGGEVCINGKQFSMLKNIMIKEGVLKPAAVTTLDYSGVITTLMGYLGVASERDIWLHPTVQKHVGTQTSEQIKLTTYKIPGPSDSNRLLNNYNIDSVLRSYALRSKDMFGKRFCALGFEMIDFANNPRSPLWNFNYNTKDWDCMGIVLNSDTSAGPGKHWFSLYVELGKPEITIEYFNSSSRLPYEEIISYYEKVKSDYPDRKVTLLTVVKHRIQESKTECGMFSIIYIIGRLEGNPPDMYVKKQLSDADMYRYRRIIFTTQ